MIAADNRVSKRAPLYVAVGAVIVAGIACRSLVAEAESEAKRDQGMALVAIVGHWTAVQDDGPASRVDAQRWGGETTVADAEAAARSVFGQVPEGFVANVTAAGAFPLAVWKPVRNFSDGTIHVRFKMVAGASDQNAGIVLGLQPNGDYSFIRYNTKDGDVAIWKYSSGGRSVIAHGDKTAQLPLNTWHELSVTVSGRKVTASVNDGAATLEHTLDKPLSGRVGVWTKRDAVTVFKDYRVTR